MKQGVFKAEKDGVPGVYRIVDGNGAVKATIQSSPQADPIFIESLAHNVAAGMSGRKMKKVPFNGLRMQYQQPGTGTHPIGMGTVIRFCLGLGNSEPACVAQTNDGSLPDRLVFDVLNHVKLSGQDLDVARKQGVHRRRAARPNP